MPRNLNKPVRLAAFTLILLGAAPAMADVKAGVDAWSRGDFAVAVREWEAPAANGDADAMFNLAQAYRLGRGVPVNSDRAEELYARAAELGHIRAADTYGLMLFQEGRREAALPYVEGAARRGDPRAQYLLGVAHFNGDMLERDWVRAYALLTLANAAGLPQAATALSEMDQAIPLEQRQQGAGLAMQLREEAKVAKATELAAAELGTSLASSVEPTAPVVASGGPVPRATEAVAVSSPKLAGRVALDDALRATGMENPADAGASFARSGAAPRAVDPTLAAELPQAKPVVVAVADAPVQAARPEPAQEQAPAPAATGPWRVQLGAFSVPGNAEKLWGKLSGRSELKGRERLMIPSGRVTKLQAGGFATRAAADEACLSLQRSGQDCLVTRS
ncbi:MAG: SPOR domain-containing protein [Porphyrobacter sp.]|nr:SPOR domain-containing protein [Porphyrobacter sp.]